jgi:hypothetical protein
MTARPLPREDWNDYFDAFSKVKDDAGRVDFAVLRLAPEAGGRPLETRRLPLKSLTYDPKDDRLEVAVHGLSHAILHPATIRVVEDEGRLYRVEVLRRDGTREVVEIE